MLKTVGSRYGIGRGYAFVDARQYQGTRFQVDPLFNARKTTPMEAALEDLYADHVKSRTQRFSECLAAHGFDELIIHSGSLKKRSSFDDQYWPLRVVPHFHYFADLRWPDCALKIDKGGEAHLFVNKVEDFWEKPTQPDFAFLERGLAITEVAGRDAIATALAPSNRSAVLTEDKSFAACLGAESRQNPEALIRELDEIRVQKTTYEIACLAQASKNAVPGHLAVKNAFEAGERTEFRLHLAYLEATHQDDVETPYKNIVALGPSAAVLHYVSYKKTPVRADSLLIDAGAGFRGYGSDITRTHVDTRPGELQKEFKAMVDRMEVLKLQLGQEVALDRPYETLHNQAHIGIAEILVDTDLVTITAEDCVTRGVTRIFFPHGLGHSLGIQTHDVGAKPFPPSKNNESLRNTATIKPGQVFTIEPGLYFIDPLLEPARSGVLKDAIDWDRVDAFRPLGGIRTEDNVVVEPKGSARAIRNLTQEAFLEAVPPPL